MINSKKLIQAKQNKADEFYTQYETIEKEIEHYPIETWQGKTVYLPCDTSDHSMFWRYFTANFERLGLKNLYATCLAHPNSEGYGKLWSYSNNFKSAGLLNGNGDFRSGECVEILKKADIIVTNPPFSLFQDFVSLLIEYKKQFLILGQINSVASKNIFSYIRDKKMWLGASIHAGDIEFNVPDDYELTGTACRVDENGAKYIRVKGIRWWTNIQTNKQVEPLKLTKHYNPIDYTTYDNYNIVEVGKTKDIPIDYEGAMAVPITFLDKYNPEQFEIIDANDCRKSESVSIKKHGFLRDKIDGKWKYVRLVIKHKQK